MQRQRHKAPLGLLGWLVAVTVWATWAPFEARVGVAPEFQLNPSFDMDTALHLLLLAPLAVVLAALAHGKESHKPFIQAWGWVALLGLLLELGQWWVEGRGLSPYDALANGIGAAVAIWGTAQLMRRGIGARPILVAVGVLVFMSVQVGLVRSVLLLNKGYRLADWNPRFVVRAGDAPGGRRPYRGHVWNAQVCAGAPPKQICVIPYAEVEARHRLTEAWEASHHVELSAHVWSSTDRQKGPARIVTFSLGPSGGTNVMLAQEARHLIFRVRTPWSGPRGIFPEFILPDAIQSESPTRVAATFTRGVITITAANGSGTVSAAFRPDFRWDAIQLRGNRNRLPKMWRGRAARVGAVIVFVSLGLAVGWLLCSQWGAAALLGPVVAASSLWAVGTWVLGPLDPGVIEYLFATGAAALGVGLAAWDWSRLRQQEETSFGSRKETRRRKAAMPVTEREDSPQASLRALDERGMEG